jgi:hypothetical protein
MGSLLICYVNFRTIKFHYFLLYSFSGLHVMEWYVEADVKSPSTLYSLLHFTYKHQNIISTHRIDVIH